ncbi:MAG: sigma-70 family RNA polymerase sigma factor, partial [Anaerovorax sp.]
MNNQSELISENKRLLDEELIIYNKELQRFIFTLTRNGDVKDEVFQNTVIRAYKSAANLKIPWENAKHIRAWLVQISKTEVTRHFDEEEAWRLKTGTAEFKEDARGMEQEEKGYQVLETLQRNEELYGLVTALKPNLAQVILAHYVYEMPFYEIAQVTAQNYGTIRTWHHR